MMKQTLLAALLALTGTAQAQNNCPCNGGVGTQLTSVTSPTLGAALAGKMVCAAVGNERWQEWHNGNAISGVVVDYKRGPGHAVDPSEQVGTYRITRTGQASSTVVVNYTYGTNNYPYRVCRVDTNTYAFCGASLGGRDITGVIVGGTGSLESCDTVVSRANVRLQPQVQNLPGK